MIAEEMATEAREKLKRARVAVGWSQARCDQEAGVTVGRTYSYERGRANPPRDFIEPLAEAWSIPVEWFYDGVDDMPPLSGTRSAADARDAMVPLVGDLPSREGRLPITADPIPAKTTFPVPAGSAFWRVSDNSLDCIRRGDLVLVIPDDSVRRDTISLIRTESGGIDLYHVVRQAGRDVPQKLGEDQEDPGEGWKSLGFAAKLRRTLAGGLTVSFECDTGLSPEMLQI